MNKSKCAHASDTGRARDHNEDSYFADPESGIFLVADGMGGHAGGEVASAMVVEAVSRDVSDGVQLDEALCRAHHYVLEAADSGQGRPGMGATVVALTMDGADYSIAWVGDSRAYLWDGGLTQLTRDHSYVQKMMDAGAMTYAEAREHPQRSIITQALGAREMDDVEPDVAAGRLYRDQKILLCSDGLSSELDDEVIADILAQDLSDEETVATLIQAANDHGGEDNITVILVSSPLTQPDIAGPGDTRPMDNRKLTRMIQVQSKARLKRRFVLAAIVLLMIALGGYWGLQTFFSQKETVSPGPGPSPLLPSTQQDPAPVPDPEAGSVSERFENNS